MLDSYRSLIYFKLSLFIRVRIEQSLLISENENFLGDRKHHQHQLQKIWNLNSFNSFSAYLSMLTRSYSLNILYPNNLTFKPDTRTSMGRFMASNAPTLSSTTVLCQRFSSFLSSLVVSYPNFCHPAMLNILPYSTAPSTSNNDIRGNLVEMKLFDMLSNTSDRIKKEIGKTLNEVNIFLDDLERKLVLEQKNEHSLRALYYLNFRMRNCLSICQLRDSYFSTKYSLVNGSGLGNESTPRMVNNIIFQSKYYVHCVEEYNQEIMPKIGERVLELMKKTSEYKENFALNQPGFNQPFIFFALSQNILQFTAHQDVIKSAYDRVILSLQIRYVEDKITSFTKSDDDETFFPARLVSFLTTFLADIQANAMDHNAYNRLCTVDPHQAKKILLIPEPEAVNIVNKMARSLISFSKDEVESYTNPLINMNKHLTHQLNRKEIVISHLKNFIFTERANQDRAIAIKLNDSHFDLITELERHQNLNKELQNQINKQEIIVKEKMHKEYSKKIQELVFGLFLIFSTFRNSN